MALTEQNKIKQQALINLRTSQYELIANNEVKIAHLRRISLLNPSPEVNRNITAFNASIEDTKKFILTIEEELKKYESIVSK